MKSAEIRGFGAKPEIIDLLLSDAKSTYAESPDVSGPRDILCRFGARLINVRFPLRYSQRRLAAPVRGAVLARRTSRLWRRRCVAAVRTFRRQGSVLVEYQAFGSTQTALSTGDVSRFTGYSPYQVRKWVASGSLKSITLPSGVRRISPSDFEQFARLNSLELGSDYYKKFPRRIAVITNSEDLLVNILSWAETFERPLAIPYSLGLVDGLITVGSIVPHVIIIDVSTVSDLDLSSFFSSLNGLCGGSLVGVLVIFGPAESEFNCAGIPYRSCVSPVVPAKFFSTVSDLLRPAV